MKRLLTIGFISLAAAIVLFAAFHYIRAQGAGSSTVAPKPKVALASKGGDPSVPHVLIATYMSDASPNFGTLQTTIFPIDNTVTFKCLLPCTLEWDQSVQLGSLEYEYIGNWVSLGVVLDGNMVGFPFGGETASDGTYATFHYQESVPLKPGTHTVESWGETAEGTYLGFYHINYRVYTP